ncbi:ATP-dependent helicase [Mycoplasmopsis felis]|uniref:ATP-dependent helicase n=1 Tax=Mycoplasmopsis felis TaxID=33923 RepID=UPI002AFE4921|nr:UvrD-helicase domain-containing protein [Mycoplasmopsis felis]WQQ09750.1 UvrD-helicase domain-containing protein [Mycoplasmopsis felis]
MDLNYVKKINLLEDLNEQQSQAVQYFDSPLRIIAGAGTGKTKVLTRKVAYLINALGISPKNILGVTFTNKAAQEMSTRISKYCYTNNEKLNIMTFHSFCSSILRKEIHHLGFKNDFTIIDEPDKLQILKEVYKKLNISSNEVSHKNAIQYISWFKNFNKDINELYKTNSSDDILNKIYIEYTNELAKNGSLDFDDLVLQTNILFSERPDVLEKSKNKYDYILIDEFQDTSVLQYEIMKSIISDKTHLTIVGDPDQTIYNWRGADVNLILNFEKDFQNSKTIVLDTNYRSTKKILDSANKLIKHNKIRYNKDLITNNEEGSDIEFSHSFNEEAEARWVINKINQLKKEKNQLKSIVILYRTNYYSRAFEQALIEEGIPHKIVNGTKFYQRSEIKDAIAFLRVLYNSNELSFKRVINVPNRLIGEKSQELIDKFVADHNSINTLDCIMKNWKEFWTKHKNIAENILDFIKKIVTYKKLLLEEKNKISTVLNYFLKEISYFKFIEKNKSLRGTAEENVMELINSIEVWETKNKDKNIEDYLNYINLISINDEYDGNTNYVTLMTIHSAKGLEYDNVFLVGMSKGLFPSYRIFQSEVSKEKELELLEEERRLAYVAVTRARKKLFLSSSRGKIHSLNIDKEPSSFITELGINLNDILLMNDNHGIDLSETSYEEIKLQNSKMLIGDIISHTIFGEGEVVDLDGDNSVVIKFKQSGETKRFNKNHHSIRILKK